MFIKIRLPFESRPYAREAADVMWRSVEQAQRIDMISEWERDDVYPSAIVAALECRGAAFEVVDRHLPSSVELRAGGRTWIVLRPEGKELCHKWCASHDAKLLETLETLGTPWIGAEKSFLANRRVLMPLEHYNALRQVGMTARMCKPRFLEQSAEPVVA